MKKLLITSLLAGVMYGGGYPYHQSIQIVNHGFNANVAGYINQIASSIADQLGQNKDFANVKDTPIALTSIVNIQNLKKTNKLGNVISESLMHEMQIRGYKIVDYKTMTNIKIDKKGEYIFSRALNELKKTHKINFVLSGTFTNYGDGVVVNCRIVDVKTSIVKSTAQAFIPNGLVMRINNSNGFNLYPKKVRTKTVKIIPGVIENTMEIEKQ